jgi:hypothetical protein
MLIRKPKKIKPAETDSTDFPVHDFIINKLASVLGIKVRKGAGNESCVIRFSANGLKPVVNIQSIAFIGQV